MYSSYQDDTKVEMPKDWQSTFHDENKYSNKTFMIGVVSGICLVALFGGLMFHVDTPNAITTELVSHHRAAVQEINEVNEYYTKFLNKILSRNVTTATSDDFQKLMEWYASDARVETDGMVVTGREGLANFFQGMVTSMIDAAKYQDKTDTLVATTTTTAYQSGSSIVYDKHGNNLGQIDYIAIWEKVDKTWRIVAEVGTSPEAKKKKE